MISLITTFYLFSISIGYGCHDQKYRSILRGHYKDVMKLQESSLLASRNLNFFAGGLDNSILFRDTIYTVNFAVGYTACSLMESITIELKQAYELNTLVIWLWDKQVRTYDLQVFASFNGAETVILDTSTSSSVVRVKFVDQFVKQFRIYNRNGNTDNSFLIMIKAEAFYEL